jgi:hypothetical protein
MSEHGSTIAGNVRRRSGHAQCGRSKPDLASESGRVEYPRQRPRSRLHGEAGGLRLCNQPGLIPIRGGIFSGLSCVFLFVTAEHQIFQEATR